MVKAGGEDVIMDGSVNIDKGAARQVGQRRRCLLGSEEVEGGFVVQF